MKSKKITTIIITAAAIALTSLTNCDSKYTPRTVPDRDPPRVLVTMNGPNVHKTYTIKGLTISPIPSEVTRAFMTGDTYRVSVLAADSVGLYNLRVGLNKDFFEFDSYEAAPGEIALSESGSYTILDVNMPSSPAKTGTLLNFNIKLKPMPAGIIAPYLAMNVIANDFGEAGRSSNTSGYSIPIAYFADDE